MPLKERVVAYFLKMEFRTFGHGIMGSHRVISELASGSLKTVAFMEGVREFNLYEEGSPLGISNDGR